MNQLTIAFFCATATLLFFAIVTMALRVYVRTRITKVIGIDDWFIAAALLFYILSDAVTIDSIRITEGKTILEQFEVLALAMIEIYLGEIFYVLAVLSVKLSIGTFLLRLVQHRVQKYIIYITLTIVTTFSIAYLCLVIFQCKPIDHLWHPFTTKGSCLPGHISTATSYTHAAIIGGSDLIFAALPIFVVYNLQMNLAMKVSVAGLLGLGAIGGITSFIRMPYVKALGEASPMNFFEVTSRLAIWTCIEPGVGIFVCCVAALRPLFPKFLGGTRSQNSNSNPAHPSNPKRYSISSPYSPKVSSGRYQMDSFGHTDSGKKMGYVTKIESRGTGKEGWLDDNESEEALSLARNGSVGVGAGAGSRDNMAIGIQRTVVFESVREERSIGRRTPDDDEHLKSRERGFC